MDWERLEERINDYTTALQRLEDACAQPTNEFIRDAVIQRFEFTFELAWKMMKLWLESKDIDVRNAKDALQEALQQGVIENGNTWTELHKMRNLTSHTYDEELADRVYAFVVNQGLMLFRQLSQKTQTWPRKQP